MVGANNAYLSGDFANYSSMWDGFVAKYAPDGTLLWSTYLGGSGDDFVRE